MVEQSVRKAPLVWWAGGIFLGLVQVLAMGLSGPLGVSTQFVIADTHLLDKIDNSYVQQHPLISREKYHKLGYGWWFDIGLLAGALFASLVTLRWWPRCTTVWWRASHGSSVAGRFLAGFIGGILILLGARFAHGCTSGQFASGWAQLAVSAIPFTITLFLCGIITAFITYRKVPQIDR